MGPECHTPNVSRSNTCRKQLDEKPIPEEDKGWYLDLMLDF
jgi:hypothetical protein